METQDIKSRLLEMADSPEFEETPTGKLMFEAAAELSRLRAENERLRGLADATDHFFKVAMPKMNIRDSCLDSEAIVAWNKLGIAVDQHRARKEGRE